MKLIFCKKCTELFSLSRDFKRCKCGHSGGRYFNDRNAEITGECVSIEINNLSFVDAIKSDDRNKDKGTRFDAFIISDDCETINRI